MFAPVSTGGRRSGWLNDCLAARRVPPRPLTVSVPLMFGWIRQ